MEKKGYGVCNVSIDHLLTKPAVFLLNVSAVIALLHFLSFLARVHSLFKQRPQEPLHSVFPSRIFLCSQGNKCLHQRKPAHPPNQPHTADLQNRGLALRDHKALPSA